MALIKIAVPVVVCVVPGEVHLAPLAIDLHGVPGVAVAGDAAVGYAGGVEQLGVDALVAFARALVAGEAAFRGAVVKAVVVFQLVERPVVQPQGHVVLGAGGFLPALGHGVVHDLRDRGACGIVDGHPKVGYAQIANVVGRIHEVEVDVIAA